MKTKSKKTRLKTVAEGKELATIEHMKVRKEILE